jgi:hypothetical protein
MRDSTNSPEPMFLSRPEPAGRNSCRQRLLPFLVLTSNAPPDKLDDKRSKDLVLYRSELLFDIPSQRRHHEIEQPDRKYLEKRVQDLFPLEKYPKRSQGRRHVEDECLGGAPFHNYTPSGEAVLIT